jgi:hypothetical protein
MAARPRAHARRRPTDAGEAALAGRREDPRLPAGLLDDDEHHDRLRVYHEHRQHDDTLTDEPDRVTRFPLPHPHDFDHLPRDRLPDCLLFFYFLLILMLDHLLLAAAPPPALPLIAWAAPRFIWLVEEGGSSAKRWTPLPRKPRRTAESGPEAGRRPGDLLRPPARDHQVEITIGHRLIRPRAPRWDSSE